MDDTIPSTGTELYRGHEIRVRATRNARGGWTPEIAMFRNGLLIEPPLPETVEPEWLTEQEAVRDGIERARFFIDHGSDFE
ncbi:DUF6566 family protein [Burkholderia gladioli]|nr:DUF6566 family protein [Burkholderia gladioli]MBW5281303.1 hypothetical protein [Burkholderia gladioli]NHH83956.1 hypothetical protein [Burkholderia gladioli]CAG9207256.1 hypothetical protein BGLA2_1810017 [Burkholderia gladioli]